MSTLPFPDFYVGRVLLGNHGRAVRNEAGCRPRGTFTRALPGAVEYMFVLQNPGEPIHGVEDRLEDGANPQELAERLWRLTGAVLDGQFRSRTLSVAMPEACELTGVSPTQCTERVLFTNLVRCTTKLGKSLDDEAIQIGADLLRTEIELWKPKCVIAYGSFVRDAMLKYGIPYHGDLPHPAARGRWLDSNQRLERVRELRRRLAAEDNAGCRQARRLRPFARGLAVNARDITEENGMGTLKTGGPVLEGRLISWVNAHGGPARVFLKPIEGRNPLSLLTHKTPQGKREEIVRRMACCIRLDDFLNFGKPLGMKGYTDVLAGLNGGYSEAAKLWGTPVIELTTEP